MIKLLTELPLEYSDVLVRVDFNLPINPDGKIIDDTRIKATVPTIKYLLEKKCKIILLSHLGRPDGADSKLSLTKILPLLEQSLSLKVHFYDDYEKAKIDIPSLPYPSVILLENLRFHKEEETPPLDNHFAKKLASLGKFYINDAFACTHRAHSSITEICKYFPHKRAAGFLLNHEIKELNKVLNPQKPFYLLLGGSKISTKIPIINSLLPKADALFIGGAMAFPFMKAVGISIGSTKVEEDQVKQAEEILKQVHTSGKQIYLPEDWKCKEDIKSDAPPRIFERNTGIPLGFYAYDIGEKTVKDWSGKLIKAKTIFWNGPFGMYEIPPFDQGTAEIASMIANFQCESIVGGGDSVAAIEKQGLGASFSHLSTGGGASLEFLEKGTLPGLQALNEAFN